MVFFLFAQLKPQLEREEEVYTADGYAGQGALLATAIAQRFADEQLAFLPEGGSENSPRVKRSGTLGLYANHAGTVP
ncbi:MAG: hypothetical protein WAK26_16775 [Terracidiphilus sp.]